MTSRTDVEVLAALVENSQDQLAYLDRAFDFVFVNRAYALACRRTAGELVGRNHFDLYPHAENRAIFEQVRDTGVPAAWREKPFVFPDQPERGVTYWDWILSPVGDGAGHVQGLVLSLRDVTDSVVTRQRTLRNEQALRESEGRYRALFESMSEGHALHEMIFDADGRPVDYRFLEVNPAFARLTGLDPRQIIGRTVREILPGLEPSWIEIYGRVVTTGRSEQFEAQASTLGRWYEVFAYRPAPGRFAASFSDITERRRIRDELVRAHEQAASLARFPEENPDPVLRLGADFTLLYANAAARSGLAALGPVEKGRAAPPALQESARQAFATGTRERSELRCGERVFAMSFCRAGSEVNVYGQDITERKRAEEALRESERSAEARATELQAVLDTVPAAVWISRDREGRRIDANRFGAELLQRPQGSNVSVTAPPGERPANFRLMRNGTPLADDELPIQAAARTGRELRSVEVDLAFDGGPVRHLLGNAAPIRDERGEPRGSVGAFIDITDRKKAEDALREANRRKDEFLGMLSHELRNPLAPIRHSVHLLEHADPVSDQASRARAVIRRQAEHLTRLVDDLLDVTRIARGKIELRPERLDLAQLVRRAADDHRSVLAGRGVRLRLDVPDPAIWIEGDPTRLAQVVGNLLQNAAKFTPQGGEVVVAARIAGGEAEVRVRDTGIGIEPALVSQLFEPFVQGARTLARSEGGLGLGLALVKGITELHGGRAWAESAGREKGAAFVIRLPLREPGLRAARERESTHRPVGSRRVLVVDDNRDAADSLAELVGMLGHTVDVAYDGPEAIAKARAHPPEVVLCDIGLPGMDGYEVARVLRSERREDLQLFAVSGYAAPEDRQRALDSGFDGHLAKPCDVEDIERVLAARRPARPPP